MKKIITIALTFVLFACAKEEKTTYTIVSGKLTGTPENKFTIRGNSFKKEINVKEDGSFTDTLYLQYNGAYEIGKQTIYLHQGKNLSFTGDVQKLNEITFTGDLSNENNYLSKKSALSKEILGEDPKTLFSVDETAFLAKINELSKKSNELLNTATFTIPDFKEKETKNITFNTAYLQEIYPDYHGFFLKKDDFKVSESFPKLDTTIDLDNEESFNFSKSYRSLVDLNFNKKTQEETKNGQTYQDVFLPKLKAIKSQNIKNSLAQSLSYEVSLANEKMEALYKDLLSISTDENFKKELTEKYNTLKALVKGKPSPKFNYENHKGGTTSLDDLKGKYVYVDVWATWCGPCVAEIPFMKEVEKKYHGKSIEFVSISIDEKKDHDKWKKFVTDKQMGGIQLYADNAFKSKFVTDYAIDGIPRFILIDPNGNIVSGDAPRPSDEKLIALFTELGI
ncbi:TlpA family protein disulfide reductase [Flavobacterium sp. xlx-214]|uniref:TlpA family protein disulfide reductase n=1 Tax=unclassified Flavobacterium TaxID=196869 RepID=UPI0013D18F41|nr:MULTISPECIES: TlpA disulfide reductase family protein [unclassified Flavobacterium]MBA5792953.1 TlpA family protein disulfide reductase [Flavobacterium sp. xlx-221]QMI84713.1 TlpA family protein disulfide reductase [Flavobacterium sp. xlx-214]